MQPNPVKEALDDLEKVKTFLGSTLIIRGYGAKEYDAVLRTLKMLEALTQPAIPEGQEPCENCKILEREIERRKIHEEVDIIAAETAFGKTDRTWFRVDKGLYEWLYSAGLRAIKSERALKAIKEDMNKPLSWRERLTGKRLKSAPVAEKVEG